VSFSASAVASASAFLSSSAWSLSSSSFSFFFLSAAEDLVAVFFSAGFFASFLAALAGGAVGVV